MNWLKNLSHKELIWVLTNIVSSNIIQVILLYQGIIISKFEITGENGKTTTFNFKFDNGLPTKPIINPAYVIGYNKEDKFYALSMYFTEKDLKQLDDLDIDDVYFSKDELWLSINDYYVVFGNLSDKIINEVKNKKLVYYFFREDNTFIDGVQLE